MFTAPELNVIETVAKTFAVLECKVTASCAADRATCVVECDPADGSGSPGTGSGTFTEDTIEVNVTGLTPYTRYSCTAYVQNDENDTSEKSAEVYFETMQDGK